jgi:hypothetical protein
LREIILLKVISYQKLRTSAVADGYGGTRQGTLSGAQTSLEYRSLIAPE